MNEVDDIADITIFDFTVPRVFSFETSYFALFDKKKSGGICFHSLELRFKFLFFV